MRLSMVVPDLPNVLRDALEGLVRVNARMLLAALRSGRPVPPLYSPNFVRYKLEPPGREWWQNVADNVSERKADCEDLATHRTAELRVAPLIEFVATFGGDRLRSLLDNSDATDAIVSGSLYPARAVCKRTGRKTIHALVEHPDGRIEDPSLALGMKKRTPKR